MDECRNIAVIRCKTNCPVKWWMLTLVVLVLQLANSPVATAEKQFQFGGPQAVSTSPNLSFDEISHARFDSLLRRYVDCDGLVCYKTWRAKACDVRSLEAYLDDLSQVDVGVSASQDGKMAFYINAYNAMTIWGILHEYPTSSIQRIDGKRTTFAIFDDLQIWDGETYRSLNGIENDVLRPIGDPRIHFALVCAARGCPRLLNQAYRIGSLHQQLDTNAREFFSKRSRFHVSRLTRTVKMSPILDWYREDFGQTDQQVVSTVMPYLPRRDQQWLRDHCDWKFKYLGYDWSLNDQCPTIGIAVAAKGYRAYSKISPCVDAVKKRFSGDGDAAACDSCDGIGDVANLDVDGEAVWQESMFTAEQNIDSWQQTGSWQQDALPPGALVDTLPGALVDTLPGAPEQTEIDDTAVSGPPGAL